MTPREPKVAFEVASFHFALHAIFPALPLQYHTNKIIPKIKHYILINCIDSSKFQAYVINATGTYRYITADGYEVSRNPILFAARGMDYNII